MKKRVVISLFLCLPFFALAQGGNYQISARNAAMGGASATISDAYSAFHNVGALGGFDEGITALAGYQRRYGLAELSLFGFGLTAPTEYGTFALTANRFGNSDLYNEQRLGLAFSNTIGFVSLGAAINYIQYSIETAGTRPLISIDFGGKVTLSEQLSFGAYIRNLNQAQVQEFTDERLPTSLVFGFSYRPTDLLMLNAELDKDLEFDEIFKIGLEYQVVNNIFLRTGLQTAPFHGSFGVGFAPRRLAFDYAYLTNNNLGDRHELSLTYRISKVSDE